MKESEDYFSQVSDKFEMVTLDVTVESDVTKFIESLDLPADEKSRLLALTPASYTGEGENLANDV